MSTVQAPPTARAAVEAFIAGWNSHDPKAVRAAFTDGGRVSDPVVADWVSGPGIEAAVQSALERFPDVAFTVVSITENGDRVVFEWRMQATVGTSSGRRLPFVLEGCDVCRVRDGRLAELRGYFDRAAIMEQLQAAEAA